MGFIQQPQTVWWRKALFQVHLWIGLFLGLYLIAICVSGSLLVFERGLLDDTPRTAHASVHGTASWDQMVHVALAAHPGSELTSIDMRSDNRRVVPIGVALHGTDWIVYVDSVSDRILSQEVLRQKHGFVEFMEDLHNQLAAGTIGADANGVGGGLLFVMTVTGIVLWWPGKRSWKRALKVNWRARWARVNWDLHSAFGFWCALLIAMWGISGAYFIFPGPFNRAIEVFSPMPSLRQMPSGFRPGETLLPVDTYIDTARRLYPDAKLAYLYMDVDRPHGDVKIFLSTQPSIPLPLLEDVITLQPATGEVLASTSSAHWTMGERVADSIYSLHFGNFGGLFWEIVWALLGMVPVLLTITGYVMWWNRVLKKKWKRLTAAY